MEINFFLFVIYGFSRVTDACVLPLDIDTGDWGLNSGFSRHSRHEREISVNDRSNCKPGALPLPTQVDTRERVSSLRDHLAQFNLDAYVIPSDDEHQSEYVGEADRRREFISEFSGSAGTAVVLKNESALWTDGRYFLQADNELDCSWILMKESLPGVPTILEWLKSMLLPGSRVGSDPKLIGSETWEKYATNLNEAEINLLPVQENLVDLVWDQAKQLRHSDPIYILEMEFAGRRWEDKLSDMRKEMEKEAADLLVVTALDEVAWLLNLRGNDIPYTPVFRAYVIVEKSRVKLFVDPNRITPAVDNHLNVNICGNGQCAEIYEYNSIFEQLRALSQREDIKKIWLPKKYSYAGGASFAIYSSIPEEKRLVKVSPILLAKARKNPIEITGMKRAHIKDSVALIDFLAMLEKEMSQGKEWDEISAATRLEKMRAEQEDFVGLSFETISAFGSNGAVIHYAPQNATNKKITKDSLYLLDSGGQYKDGTTDVTRTMHYGTPTEFQKEMYTRVLMGALDLAHIVFADGTSDSDVDILARRPLYEVGLDYRHGTGHGIGMFLGIHEAPTQVRIYSKEEHLFEKGQFFSDEPGYYQDNEFGIRLETILTVVEKQTKYKFDKKYLGFEAVTLVPFEHKLVKWELLSRKQCEYLNNYHSEVIKKIGPELLRQGRKDGYDWMMAKTVSVDCSRISSVTNVYPESQAISISDGTNINSITNTFHIVVVFTVLQFVI